MEKKQRFSDLLNQSAVTNRFLFTEFLSFAEQSELYEIKGISERDFTGFGGYDDAERILFRFGNPEELGYEEPFPIVILKIEPLAVKFADELNHRDFLGALMNLGIKREVLGDILVTKEKGKECVAYLFCLSSIVEYIVESLDRIKHTSVRVTRVDTLPEIAKKPLEERAVQVASERMDAVLASVYKLSRSESQKLIAEERVFRNGRAFTNNGTPLKEGDRISVRGFGRFFYDGVEKTSKKGRLYIKVRV